MKTSFTKLALVSSAVAFYCASAASTPIINTSSSSDVKVPTGALFTDWYYGSNNKDLYIAPPSTGKVIFNNFVPQNATFCTDLGRLRAVEQDSNSTMALLNYQINQLAIEQGEYEWVLDDKGNVKFDENHRPIKKLDASGNPVRTAYGIELAEARKKKLEASLNKEAKEKALERAEKIERDAKSLRDDARDELKDCKDDAGVNDEDWRDVCEDEYSSYKDANNDYRDARRDKRTAENDKIDAEIVYEKAKDTYQELIDNKASVQTRITNLYSSVSTQKLMLANVYKEIKGIFGGQVNMSYRTQWNELAQRFQNANPDHNIRRVTINKAVLTAPMSYVYDNTSALGQFTGVAWSNLNIANNVMEGDFTTMPDGTLKPVGDGVKERMVGWADSFQGSFGLYLPNACVVAQGTEGLTGGDLNNAYSKNFNQYISPSIGYTYDVRADYGYKASYNLSQMMEIVEKVTKKTGFFNSSSRHDIEKEFDESEAFVMEYIKDARGNGYLKDEDKQALTSTIRERLLTRALDSVGRKAMVPDTKLSLVEAEETGATTLAKKLNGRCKYGWGWECWGGWALYAANSIWGGRSEQVATFKVQNNKVVTEEVRDHFFVELSGSIGFEK